MDETKPWYESKGAWANLLQFATSMGVMTHVVNSDQAAVIAGQGPTVAVMVVMAGLAVYGFYGRIVATKRVTIK